MHSSGYLIYTEWYLTFIRQGLKFTVDSTRQCDVCSHKVKIGTGGESNWTIHLRSKAHVANEKKHGKSGPRNSLLTSFFKLQEPTMVLAAPPYLADPLAPTTSRSSVQTCSTSPPTVCGTSQPTSPSAPKACSEALDLISTVRKTSKQLPDTIPIASSLDLTASLSATPRVNPEGDEEPFMVVNQGLHAVFGWNQTAEELRTLVRRGPLGVAALCDWLEYWVQNHGITVGLLEARLFRLIEAMQFL